PDRGGFLLSFVNSSHEDAAQSGEWPPHASRRSLRKACSRGPLGGVRCAGVTPALDALGPVVVMQFGIFSVSDLTTDPTTGRTPSEAERISAVVTIARKAEEVGPDVFALGEHHNPPFFSSSPTTTLGYI